MATPKLNRIPPLELEAMKMLWQLGEGTVRDVAHELSRRRPLAYTTVLTLLDRLMRRGAAGRRKNGRAHVYYPIVSREAALELALDRLTYDFFEGSRERLVEHLESESPTVPTEPRPSGSGVLDAAFPTEPRPSGSGVLHVEQEELDAALL